MKTPDVPENEHERLALLKQMGILDSASEERFERITRVLCRSLDVPISAISLIDNDRQWFKSIQGLDISETPRDVSFCAHSIIDGKPLTVEDATQDERFADNALVINDPNIRFYAGIPIKIDDIYIGALCAIDRKPRQLTDDQAQVLNDLGHIVEQELISMDLQKQFEIKQDLMQSQAFLSESQNILENSLNEIYIFDVKTLKFTHANHGARANIGFSLSEMKQLSPLDLKPNFSKDEFLKLLSPLKDRTEEKIVFRTQHKRKNGSLYDAEVHLQLGQYNGQDAFIAIILDVSENEALIRKLTAVNEELEEFAYRTSHDLRSPLISSINLAELAERYIDEKNEAQAKEALRLSALSLKKLEALVKDILSLSQTKNEQEQEQEIDVKALIDNTLKQISHLDGFDRIKITLDLKYNKTLSTKRARLQLILENLISNAVKYHDPAHEEPFIKIMTKEEDGDFVFCVEDNGLGIPKEYQSQLFKMFKRFHAQAAFGSGLGLYMIKKSSEIIGGHIAFKDLNGGSCFKLTLPTDTKDGA